MDENTLRERLKILPVPKIIHYEEIDSTNEQALNLIAAGADEFTLLSAENQTAGRGRLGRKWVTTPGSSLAFTVILHPNYEERQRMGFFSFLGALSLCLAIEEISILQPFVKWPNDVLLDDKKTAGILAESSFQGDHLAGVALGIGVNMLPGSVPPAEEVMFPATCVGSYCHPPPECEDFLAAVLTHLIDWRSRILDKAFLDAYRARLAFIGQRVVLVPPAGKEIEGLLFGVDDGGHLVLKLEEGEFKAFPVGDLKLRVT